MHRPYCLPLWCATILLVAAATGARAQVDPKALLQKQFETLARGDGRGRWPCIRMMRSSTGRVCVQRLPVWARPRSSKSLSTDRPQSACDRPQLLCVRHRRDRAIRRPSNSTQQAGVDRIIGWKIVGFKAGKIGSTRGPVGADRRADGPLSRASGTQQATR